MRKNPPESALHPFPLRQDLSGPPTARLFAVPGNDSTHRLHFVCIVNAFQLHQFTIIAHREHSCHVQDISHARRHSRSKVPSCFPQYDYHSSRHILAGMLTCSLHNRQRPAIAYGKALTGTTRGKQLPTGRSIEGRIAENSVFVRSETSSSRWCQNNL